MLKWVNGLFPLGTSPVPVDLKEAKFKLASETCSCKSFGLSDTESAVRSGDIGLKADSSVAYPRGRGANCSA